MDHQFNNDFETLIFFKRALMVLGKPPLLWINPHLKNYFHHQFNLHSYLEKNFKFLQNNSFEKPSTRLQSGRNYELLSGKQQNDGGRGHNELELKETERERVKCFLGRDGTNVDRIENVEGFKQLLSLKIFELGSKFL